MSSAAAGEPTHADGAPAATDRDAAWVVLQTRWPATDLALWLTDVRRLYRINPFLEITLWQHNSPGHFHARLFNHSNGQAAELVASLDWLDDMTLQVNYASGIKQSTRFAIETIVGGSRLTITDEYVRGITIAPEQVDRSLHAWGVAMAGYLARDRRWGWLPLYRWFMEKVWLPMKPSARRITFIVLVISLADIALIALGFTIYWLEFAG